VQREGQDKVFDQQGNLIHSKFRECFNNVVPEFDGKSQEEIKSILKSRAIPGAVLMMQLVGDFNFSNVIRTANALGLCEIFYCGPKKHYDRRGAVGSYKYTDVNYISDISGLFALKDRYAFVGLEQSKNSIMLNDYKWNKPSMIILGEEGSGLETSILDMCDDVVEIPQIGSIRSLNAATAAGIAIWSYVNSN